MALPPELQLCAQHHIQSHGFRILVIQNLKLVVLCSSHSWHPGKDWSFYVKLPTPLIMPLVSQRWEKDSFFRGHKQQILFSSSVTLSRRAVNAKQYGFLEWWVTASDFFKAIIHPVWISSRWASKSVIEIKRMAKIPKSQKINLG